LFLFAIFNNRLNKIKINKKTLKISKLYKNIRYEKKREYSLKVLEDNNKKNN